MAVLWRFIIAFVLFFYCSFFSGVDMVFGYFLRGVLGFLHARKSPLKHAGMASNSSDFVEVPGYSL